MIYVDPLMDYGWRLGKSCHMFADTLEELHEFARKIGMKRAWFQDKPTLPHYDLTEKRRAKAVKMGASECDHEKTVEYIRRKRNELRETSL